MRLLATTKLDLLDRDDIAGKREVYYNSKSWGECRFEEQTESDSLLDDIEAMLGVNREVLGYIPEERGGEVCGPLVVVDRDPGTGRPIRIDCTRLGTGAWSIPSRVELWALKQPRGGCWWWRRPRCSSGSCITGGTRRRAAF